MESLCFWIDIFSIIDWNWGREICLTLTKSSGHCWFQAYFFVVSYFFFCSIQFQCSSSFKTWNGQNIWLISCAACFYKNTQSSNSNHFQGCSPLFPDICHPLKSFFVLLPFEDFAQMEDTSVRDVTMSTQRCKWNGVWSLILVVGGG